MQASGWCGRWTVEAVCLVKQYYWTVVELRLDIFGGADQPDFDYPDLLSTAIRLAFLREALRRIATVELEDPENSGEMGVLYLCCALQAAAPCLSAFARTVSQDI